MEERPEPIDLEAREAAQRESDARATLMLKRVGIGLAIVMAIWLPIVMLAFVGE